MKVERRPAMEEGERLSGGGYGFLTSKNPNRKLGRKKKKTRKMREKQRGDGEEDMGRRLERREEQRSRGRRSREFFVRERERFGW